MDLAYLFVRALHPLLQRPGTRAQLDVGKLPLLLLFFFGQNEGFKQKAIFVDTLSSILDSTNAEKFA